MNDTNTNNNIAAQEATFGILYLKAILYIYNSKIYVELPGPPFVEEKT